jgi:uncharacterized SAM-binding protein YcdF (DUF218 family)
MKEYRTLCARLKSYFILFLACIGGLLIFVTMVPVTTWLAWHLAGNEWSARDSGEVLIVLGGDGPNGGLIGQESYWRGVYAVRAWRTGAFHHLLISGGGGSADSIRDFVISHGVPTEAVQVERSSASTRENAVFVAERLRGLRSRPTLLTGDYHMYRAARAFRKVGLDVYPHPYPEAIKHSNTWWHRWDVFMLIMEEGAKIAWYRLLGWI